MKFLPFLTACLGWPQRIMNSYTNAPPKRDFFYVDGKYVNLTIRDVTKHVMVNQIYVKKLTPVCVTQEQSIIFIAGAAQTGTNFLDTPDGRPGWSSFFLSQGNVVYLTDQTQRGPHLHTQWLDTRRFGDPVFDALFAPQMQFQSEFGMSDKPNQKAYSYEPSAGPNATDLQTILIPPKDDEHTKCIMQAEPAKKLKNLANVPVLVVSGEASYHAPYEHCTVAYLRQAGLDVQFADLGEEFRDCREAFPELPSDVTKPYRFLKYLD
ncbi:hypothetical protein P154DRAFT_542597 [Amniculicola lignicola CBS 123094]|uniref:Alpha/beta-hydrolase n=1 Tax=Amniculicola lignicola CBS 123094 TaxID=1392246 RepID=A0A6A5WVA4_9PLEO|nr:hypothetical protein P154DRAFT_542597 [Amniculicola lignicola CBS 123094]